MRRTSPLGLAQSAIVIGTGLGFVLSYSALRRLAGAHGYDGWESVIWPLAVDFVAVACTSLAMALAERHGGPTGETWTVAAAAATVSLTGNVVSAWGDPIAMVMHGWAAGVYIALWHVYFRTVQCERPALADRAFGEDVVTSPAPPPAWPAIRSDMSGSPDPVPSASAPVTDVTPPERPHPDPGRVTSEVTDMSASDARQAVIGMVQRARAKGQEVTLSDVQRATGRGDRQARRLLNAATAAVDSQARPRVVRS